MSVIPCQRDDRLRRMIEEYADVLKSQAHTLGSHGLSEEDFYRSGLFRGAVERVRGQFSATMREKREFMRLVLNFMEDEQFIRGWESAGESNRHDYVVEMPTGTLAAIELKGCLDGNNTNIFERPPHANEFYVWSICLNTGADPRKNAWSGIHTRLSAEVISRNQLVDGVIVWDMLCGTLGRPCPKISGNLTKGTEVGRFVLPPPCIFLLPATIPSPRNNASPVAQDLSNLEFASALHGLFRGDKSQLSYVDFEVKHDGAETVRKTTVRRDGVVQQQSEFTPIRRT